MMRLGIAGCGWAGERHATAINVEPRAELVAVADPVAERRRAFAAAWDVAHGCSDFRELCDRPDLDAVIVALPHDLHRDAVATAAGAGLHILCEKPIAVDLAAADEMVDAAAAAGVTFMVAESARFEPLSMRVEQLLAEGAAGTVVHAHRTWLHKFSSYDYGERAWLNSAERAGGGQWLLNGVHVVSTLCGWMEEAGAGPVREVLASEYRSPNFESPPGIEASVSALLTFAGGMSASIVMAVEVEHHGRFSGLRLYGTEGTVVADAHRRSISIFRQGQGEPEAVTVSAERHESFKAQLAYFLDCVKGHVQEPLTSGLRERNTLAVIRAGYRSMATGRSCTVELRGDSA